MLTRSRAFPRFAFALSCLAVLAAPVLSAGVTEPTTWVDAPSAFVVLRDESPGAMHTFADVLETAGGHLAVAYPPRAAVVFAADRVLASGPLQDQIAVFRRGTLDPAVFTVYGSATERASRAWNAALLLPEPVDALPDGFTPFPDAGPRPEGTKSMAEPNRVGRSADLPFGAQYYDTSEFMAGSCAVGVWLLEAAGPTYEWTSTEETQTLGGVQAGMANWVRKGGTPAGLSFELDIHTDVPVSGVPIENPMSYDQVWIDEVLGNAGWAGANAFEKCFAYNNSIRDDFGTNWCFSIFIADSNPAVNQGLFQGGGYAWAYYGGPWIYMSRFSSWAYNASRYWAVVPMHETGHIFMATDEYDGYQQWQGYLNESDNPSTSVICIENQNDSTRVCPESQRQLGWRDVDSDGIIDILAAPPAVTLNPALPDPTSNPTPVWTGSAGVTTIPNLNPASWYYPPHDMTLARITTVECRVDAGAWSPATAGDGAFDGYVEPYSWMSPPLLDGTHVVEARALTSAGIWSTTYPADTLTVGGAPEAVTEAAGSGPRLAIHTAGPNPTPGASLIEYSLPEAGAVDLTIYSGNGAKLRSLLSKAPSEGSARVFWNGRDDQGRAVPAGVYLCRLTWAGRSVSTKLVVAR